MPYYKFKSDSKEYQILFEYDARIARWYDETVVQRMEEFLGCKLDKDSENRLLCDSKRLSMRNPPEHLKPNFKKPFSDSQGYVYECKLTTKLNREWQALCKELSVEGVRLSDWAWKIGWFNGKGCNIHRSDTDYYVEPNHGTFDTDEFLEPIDGATFFRMRADLEEKNGE